MRPISVGAFTLVAEPANLLSQFSDFPAQLFDFGAAGGRASARPARHHADARQDHHTGSVAVACHLFTFRHGQVVGLMMHALDEKANEAQAADSGDSLGIFCVLCGHEQA